ncbi:MAG: hypothetical protein AB8B87_05420 [Granulosicoccus sp.]
MKKKSQLIQLLLSVLFGPLGLFYSSLAGGVLFTLVAAGLSVGFFGVGWFLVYPIVLFTGFFTVSRRNREFREGERRHQEVVDAARRQH